MDLSQQELPLTAYFTRGSEETKSRAVSCRKGKSAQHPQSVAHSSKCKRSSVGRSTMSPSDSSAGSSRTRPTTMQLPTPATSSRKRMRSERLETSKAQCLPAVVPNLAQLVFEDNTSKLIQSSRRSAEDNAPLTPLAMASIDRRKPVDMGLPTGLRLSDRAETGIATPQTSSRRVTEPLHDTHDRSPLARSNCRLPPRLRSGHRPTRLQDPDVFHAVLPNPQSLVRSTTVLLSSSVDSGSFPPRETNGIFVPQDDALAQPKQCPIQSETSDKQPSDVHVIPMIPIPSSQSQYLLHLDATPKRKRCSRHIEPVMSSQTQEEWELTLPVSHKAAAIVSLTTAVSPRKHTVRGNLQTPHFICSERRSRNVCALGSTLVGSSVKSSPDPPRCSTKKVSDGASPKPKNLSPLRPNRPSSKTKTPRLSVRCDSIENIPPVHIEDSLTEPESDSDIFQVPRHLPVLREACLPNRGFDQGDYPEDDSATEAESDTEILHCVAEIGKQRACKPRSEPREDTPPVISPLVSPTRPRIAAVLSNIGDTQLYLQKGDGLDIPGSCAPYLSAVERSESLPSVVREFIRMFPGDESYPADFPESLRI